MFFLPERFPKEYLPVIRANGGNLDILKQIQKINKSDKMVWREIGKQKRKASHWNTKVFKHMQNRTRVLLREFFKPFNILLADLLQDKAYLKWNDVSNI